MSTRLSDHFPKMVITQSRPKTTLEGKESVEEFLARGGKITKVDSGVMAEEPIPAKQTREEVLDRYREKGHKKAVDNGSFTPPTDRKGR